jgi:hypothetical protein
MKSKIIVVQDKPGTGAQAPGVPEVVLHRVNPEACPRGWGYFETGGDAIEALPVKLRSRFSEFRRVVNGLPKLNRKLAIKAIRAHEAIHRAFGAWWKR